MFPSRRITTSGGDVFRDEYSLAFDGTNDYVQLGTAFQSTFRDSFTISMWIKPDDGQPSSLEIIIGCNNTSDQDSIAIVLEADGDIAFSYQSDDDKVVGTSDETVFADGQAEWTHIVCSASSGGNLVTFINGVIKDTSSATTATFGDWTSTDALYIGANNDGGTATSFFAGKISEVAIWSEALSSNQAKQLYNGREPFDAKNMASSNLKGYWRMGDGVLDHRQTLGLVADQVNATIGSELWDTDASTFVGGDTISGSDNVYGWARNGTNTIAIKSNQLEITYVNIGGDQYGAKIDLRDSTDLNSDLVIGKLYKLQCDARYEGGSSGVMLYWSGNGGASVYSPVLTTTMTTYILYFTSESTTGEDFQLSTLGSSNIVYIDNLSLKQVNGNAGKLVNFDGTDFKTDVPR